MPKQKKKPTNIKPNHPQKLNKQKLLFNDTPLAPATQTLLPPKRKIADLSLFLKREESISPPTIELRYTFQQIFKSKSLSIELLALQCENFQAAINKISKLVCIDKNLLISVIQCYIQGSKHLLWSDKYCPKNLKQCLHQNVGDKIMKWIRLYTNFRNNCPQESNSLLDYFGDENSNNQYKILKQNGWKLRGLIIKGRSGVGKTCAVTSTAKQLECQIFNCGNQCNQIKYLKEKNEATQSECVKTKINKNQTQIQKSNKTITAFAIRNQEIQNQNPSKRIQFMHEVNNFYPQEDSHKFFNELNKTIESSKIPFVMTLTGQNIPQSLKLYDVIQFQEAHKQNISNFLFLIFHIEKSFSQCLNLDKVIQRDRFKDQLNQQFKNFEFEIISPLQDFIKLTQISNKKLDFLFTFIEHSFKLQKELNLNEAQLFMKEYLKRSNEDKLMNDYFYVFTPQNINKEDQDSKQFVIDSKYLIFPQNNHNADNQVQLMQSTSSNSKKFTDIKKINISKQVTVIQKSLKQTIQQFDMKVIHDYKSQIQKDQCFMFNKLYDESRQELQQNITHNIQMYFFDKQFRNCHNKIRKQIIKNVRRQFYYQNELTTSIKDKQLNCIGFLIDSRSRVSRKKINKQDLNLKKFLKNNQINCLKNFTEFIKPSSCQSKF